MISQEEMREITPEEKEEKEEEERKEGILSKEEISPKEEIINKRDPEKRQQKIDLDYDVKINETRDDNHLTMSTKLSTDRLICKSPKESPISSLNGEIKREKIDKAKKANLKVKCRNLELYLGVLQILFGVLMTVLGVLTIMHKASLSQIGGGIWGGCLAISSGTVGLLTAAKSCCPLKRRAYDIAQTVFLALSLITVAVSQLVLVLAATGLSRDVYKQDTETNQITPENGAESIPSEKALLGNVGLILTSALQFITSSLTCYKIARSVCPCFKNDEEQARKDYNSIGKQAFINSWLGKQSPPFYVVAAPSTLGKGSKLSSGLSVTPIYTIPSQNVQPRSLIGYPLIPAPLGNIPSPIIRSNTSRPKEYIYTQPIYPHKELALTEKQKKRQRKSRSKSKEKSITTEELTKTYTGLDKIIAEEFIDICESRNNSLCSSESSCQSCCQCNSQNVCSLCSSGNGSEGNSGDCLVNTQQ